MLNHALKQQKRLQILQIAQMVGSGPTDLDTLKMRRFQVGGNWKCNTTRKQAVELATDVAKASKDCSDKVDIVVYVPFVYLDDVKKACEGSKVIVGAQNFYPKQGAFTGEVSIGMLKDIGIKSVLVGHSERRHVFNEADALLNTKVRAALDEGFDVCFCIGEKIEEREAGKTDEVNKRQLTEGLKGVSAEEMARIVIAYEPVWAIGTGRTATPEDVKQAHLAIRNEIEAMYSKEVAAKCPIQYGGSVKPANAEELFKLADVDGGLIGGASLKAKDFDAIVKASKL